MRKFPVALVAATALLGASVAYSDLVPLTSFRGDGWFAPGEDGYGFLGTANNERGIAYNPATGDLLLVSRTGGPSIRVLNGLTGVETGTMTVDATITGGTFVLSMIGASDDGVIYAANLTTNATTSPYKVYRWANQTAAPTVAFSGAPLAGARFGDTLDVFGSGTSTQIAAGISNSPVVAGNNGFGLLRTTDGLSYTGTAPAFTGTPPDAGDFRLGISFVDADTMIGAQKGGLTNPGTPARVADFTDTAATLVASPAFTTSSERLMDVAVIAGIPFLALQSTGDSTVRIYDITDPTAPILYDTGNNTSGTLTGNANGVGQVKWGAISGNSAILYAMSTNQGIQAFTFTIPEPASLSLAAIGAVGLLRRRRI
jgi:hypothetical protein